MKIRGGAQGRGKSKSKARSKKSSVRTAHTKIKTKKQRVGNCPHSYFDLEAAFDFALLLIFALPSHHPPPSSTDWSGDFGEDCLSTKCEFRSRLARRATQGTSQRWWIGVAFSWVAFFLAKQKKVTSGRATPGKARAERLLDEIKDDEEVGNLVFDH